MAKKYGLIIDITRSDGCGSDILSIADEMTGNYNKPCDSEIPDGKVAEWMNLREYEQGQNMKVKMDYVPEMYPFDSKTKPMEAIYDDPTMDKQWGDLNDPDSDVAKFVKEHADEITKVTPKGLDYELLYYKMPKPFIAGELANADGTECKKGIKVTLLDKKSGKTKEETTDFLGDFQFLRLDKGGDYVVTIDGCDPIEVKLDEAKDLGTICF